VKLTPRNAALLAVVLLVPGGASISFLVWYMEKYGYTEKIKAKWSQLKKKKDVQKISEKPSGNPS